MGEPSKYIVECVDSTLKSTTPVPYNMILTVLPFEIGFKSQLVLFTLIFQKLLVFAILELHSKNVNPHPEVT